jgi:hypothetical protein
MSVNWNVSGIDVFYKSDKITLFIEDENVEISLSDEDAIRLSTRILYLIELAKQGEIFTH